MQSYFSGYNGFKQFGNENGTKATTFKQFKNVHSADQLSELSIAATWSYTAVAFRTDLTLSGFLNGAPNAVAKIAFPDSIKEIAACDRHCLVVLNNGKLLKILPDSTDGPPREIKFAVTQRPVKRSIFGDQKNSPNELKIKLIAVGSNIAVALSDENVLYSIPNEIHSFPRHVSVKQLVCGFEHALLLTGNGDIFSWGNGLRGQLGHEDLKMLEVPAIIEALAGIKIINIAAGGWHSAAISAFGDLYTWGYNSNGQLGLRLFKLLSTSSKEPSVYPLPQLIETLKCCGGGADDAGDVNTETCSPLKVFAGGRHTIVFMSCGSLLSSGWNEYGQLSLDTLPKNYADSFGKVHCIESSTIKFENCKIVCGDWNTILAEKL